MKKTIILTENDLNTLTSGGEVAFSDDSSIEIHVVTQATSNRRKAIEKLSDILRCCNAVRVADSLQDTALIAHMAEYTIRGGSIITADYRKLAEVAYDYLVGE